MFVRARCWHQDFLLGRHLSIGEALLPEDVLDGRVALHADALNHQLSRLHTPEAVFAEVLKWRAVAEAAAYGSPDGRADKRLNVIYAHECLGLLRVARPQARARLLITVCRYLEWDNRPRPPMGPWYQEHWDDVKSVLSLVLATCPSVPGVTRVALIQSAAVVLFRAIKSFSGDPDIVTFLVHVLGSLYSFCGDFTGGVDVLVGIVGVHAAASFWASKFVVHHCPLSALLAMCEGVQCAQGFVCSKGQSFASYARAAVARVLPYVEGDWAKDVHMVRHFVAALCLLEDEDTDHRSPAMVDIICKVWWFLRRKPVHNRAAVPYIEVPCMCTCVCSCILHV